MTTPLIYIPTISNSSCIYPVDGEVRYMVLHEGFLIWIIPSTY